MANSFGETPPFWWKRWHLLALAFSPIGMIYGHIALRMGQTAEYFAPVPVCAWGILSLAVAKTPTVIHLVKALKKRI